MRITCSVGILIGVLTLATGCTMPPLDDAQLGTVRLATTDDFHRYDSAELIRSREGFGSATIHDRETGVTTTFNDFDAYRAYEKSEGRESKGLAETHRNWPILRISFRTRQILIRPDDYSASGWIYFCDADDPMESDLFGSADVVWRGRFLAGRSAQEIEAALTTAPAGQEYEILFPYTKIEEQRPVLNATSVTLAAPTNDLCFSLVGLGMLHPPFKGRPLRIDKESLGPLPRPIPIR
jgi:hypothetical protein